MMVVVIPIKRQVGDGGDHCVSLFEAEGFEGTVQFYTKSFHG